MFVLGVLARFVLFQRRFRKRKTGKSTHVATPRIGS